MTIALTCKIRAAGSQGLGGTMVTVLYVLCVLCVVVCARGGWFLGVRHWRTIYGIVLGVGISILVLDTYAILVKYFAQEYGGREKK
jgi:hypothetical protein